MYTYVNTKYTMECTQGVTVDYNGKLYNFRGYALVFIGDTPAAALAGGFKEGVGGAHRGCRTCMITSHELDKKVCVYLTYMYVCPLWVMSVMGYILLYAA